MHNDDDDNLEDFLSSSNLNLEPTTNAGENIPWEQLEEILVVKLKELRQYFLVTHKAHMDASQIFCSFHNEEDDNTMYVAGGIGNIFTRKGMIHSWVVRTDTHDSEAVKSNIIASMFDDIGDIDEDE